MHCAKCGSDNFSARGVCRPCHAAYMRVWVRQNWGKVRIAQQAYRKNNAEKVAATKKRWTSSEACKTMKRDYHLRMSFGLSLQEYITLAVKQGGCCAICRRQETKICRNGKLQPLSVDHDHATGKIRGLICDSCNVAIGRMDDDPRILRAAARYIEEHAGKAAPLAVIGGL